MLRNRSPRAVTSKQAKMGDHTAQQSPIENQRKPISYFLASPKLFKGFVTKGGSEFEPMKSPTSILDSNRPFSTLSTHFLNMPKTPESTFSATKHSWENFDSRGIALLLDSPNCEKGVHNLAKPIKLGSPGVIIGSLTASEMELSEDYTCVISHGSNPKTTHFYDNCIVESCGGVVGLFGSKECSSFSDDSSFRSESFLSFCYTCKKNLGHEKDIYIYRGEKAFCSPECRCQEMMFDDIDIDNFELQDAFRT